MRERGWSKLFRGDDRRPLVVRAARLGVQAYHLARLPGPVRRFWLRALASARRAGDTWSIDVASRPVELRTLLRTLDGARSVAEIGTGAAWTSAALALADPARVVETWDVERHPQRERALALLAPEVRERIHLHDRPGGEGPAEPPAVDAVFIDSSHERDETMATFRTWAGAVPVGGVVALHDWADPRYPGVTEAIEALGLSGETAGRLFVWRRPPP